MGDRPSRVGYSKDLLLRLKKSHLQMKSPLIDTSIKTVIRYAVVVQLVEPQISNLAAASSSLVYRSMLMGVCNFNQRKKKRIVDR